MLVGVIVDFLYDHGDLVSAYNLYRFAIFRRVVPTDDLTVSRGFIHCDRAIRVDRAHVHLWWRSREFGLFKVRRPRASEAASWYAGSVRRQRGGKKSEH